MSFALHKIKYFQLASATLIVAAMATGSFATEAPIKTERYTLNVETFASGLTSPWSVALLPYGLVLITEKPGNLRVMRDGKLFEKSVAGLPVVTPRGQGGLLDVVARARRLLVEDDLLGDRAGQ